MGIFSGWQIDDIFLIFTRKQGLTFHANCLLRRQFAWNVKSCFLGKIRKIFQNVVCWKFYPECLALIYLAWQGLSLERSFSEKVLQCLSPDALQAGLWFSSHTSFIIFQGSHEIYLSHATILMQTNPHHCLLLSILNFPKWLLFSGTNLPIDLV